MTSLIFPIILFTSILLNIQLSYAQRTFSSQDASILEHDQRACWQSPQLALTEDQMIALESLQKAYTVQGISLWRELISLRFELRHLARDLNVQSKILFDRQKKISELQARINTLLLSYQIKPRSIFTKEQLGQLPQDCPLGMGTGYRTGKDKRPRNGLR